MASAITLEGIDRAISNLNYKNKNTLKYRYVQQIRQYYTIENAVVSLNEIDHEALIKILWDTDHRLETIKNKRKNLNSLRSSVNADFKKLYEKGENPEGIKIGSNNIFAMSEDAKDKILKKIGYDLQPDGTLKLDQIMDILKVANEAVSGSMAVEDTEKKDGLKKIDRLKDLIKGLSEKVGLGQDQTDKGIVGKARDQVGSSGAGFESGDKKDGEGIGGDLPGKGDEDETGSSDTAEILDDALMDEVDEVEEIADLDDEVEVVDDIDDEVMLDDIEDVEVGEISDTETEDLLEASEIEEELEDVLNEEEEELDDVEDIIEDDILEEVSDESGSGIEDSCDDTGPGQGLGLDKIDEDIGGGTTDQTKSAGTGFDPGDKEDGESLGDDIAAKGDKDGTGSTEMAEILDEAPLDEIDEVEEIADLDDDVEVIDDVDDKEILDDVEDIEVDEILDTKTDELLETAGIEEDSEDILDEEEAELDDIEDFDDVEDIIEDDISVQEADGSGTEGEDIRENIGPGQGLGQDQTGEGIVGKARDQVESSGTGFESADKENGVGEGSDIADKRDEDGAEQKGNEPLGLPVGSLGQEYSLETDGKIEKAKLLAEEFDGYLGSMDRYYNYYILIPGGEYLIGSKHPKKDERPEQTLYLESYYIGRYPITNGLFEIFIEKTGYKTTAEKVGYGTVYYGRFEKKKDATTGLITSTWNASLYCKKVEGACWYRPSGPESTLYNKRNHPVVQISMNDAMAFAAWTGKRLPTENEWESASRTANGWIFPWGPEWKNDACNIEDSCIADTTPVDKYVEFGNDFGIVDTLGNVLEWTTDRFDSTSKSSNGEKYRVVRGGSWISGNDVRLFSRFIIQPESHSNILGFRCVAY